MILKKKICRSILIESTRLASPKRILIIGSNYSIIKRILRKLTPTDDLVICETDDELKNKLEATLCKSEHITSKLKQIKVYSKHPWELEAEDKFNFIILTIPLNKLSDQQIDKFMNTSMDHLEDGGILTCVEYALLRRLSENIRYVFQGLFSRTSRRSKCWSTLDHYTKAFQVYQEIIWLGFTFMWVRNFRFTPFPTDKLDLLRNSEERYTVHSGPVRFSKDIHKFTPPLVVLAMILRKAGKRYWYFPLALLTGVIAFLRDPQRQIKNDPTAILSACDGTVIEIETIKDPNLGDNQWLRIAAFLSLNNIHVNRAPISGRVIDQFEMTGGAARAYHRRAVHNTACYTVLDTQYGQVAVVQRVGMIARRIFNWAGTGDTLAQGERYGLIRMGSRTDIYLPYGKFQPTVKVGDKVIGGITVVALANEEDEA